MSTAWKPPTWFAVIVFSAAIFTAATAVAEPIRLTVNFSVTGDNNASVGHPAVDPLFGTATGIGFFSLTTIVPTGGGVVQNPGGGLKADALALDFGGTAWTTANADVTRLDFNSQGALAFWQLSGVPDGLFRVSFQTFPDILVEPFDFSYTNAASPQLGVFKGNTVTSSVTM